MHFRSKALERTILKISEGLSGARVNGGGLEGGEAYLLHVNAVACAAEDEACSHSLCESTGLGRS